MTIRIEDAFNDCFERMLMGESMESCLNSYPEHAAELNIMLRTTYDVKRKAYPIQPRPDFKYWARARMQGIQAADAAIPTPTHRHSISFNMRRNLAISLSAILVFVIASSGTVAASNDAMPDEPLYNVKLVVEEAQVALTPSDTGKVELYAKQMEKRAQEISVMAAKGNNDKVVATTRIMNTQLQKIEESLSKFEAETADDTSASATPWATTTQGTTATTTTTPAAANTSTSIGLPPVVPDTTMPDAKTLKLPPALPGTSMPGATDNTSYKFVPPQFTANVTTSNTGSGQSQPITKRVASINKAREAINNSTSKSVAILQNTLDKAPASVQSSINNVLSETITNNKRIQAENLRNTGTTNKATPNTLNKDTDNKTRLNIDANIKPNINKNLNDRIKNQTILNNTTNTSK